MKRPSLVIGSLALLGTACTSSPNAATANEPCSAYIASHDDTHTAVTRHVAAVLWAGMIDAAAPAGTVHVTPVKTLVDKINPDQMSAAETVVTQACRAAPTASALGATLSAVGTGTIHIPPVFEAR